MRSRMKHPILFENVRTIARRLGVDQTQLGEMCGGVSQGTVSRWGETSVPRGKTLLYLAELAGVTARQLLEERLPADGTRKVRVIGFVGAGAAVYAFEALGLNAEQPTIDLPSEIKGNAALTVKGDSLYPDAEEGWSVVYVGGKTTDVKDIAGHLCVVQVEDGRMLVKKVEPGTKRGLYHLISRNAPTMEDQRLVWAARVTAIVPN